MGRLIHFYTLDFRGKGVVVNMQEKTKNIVMVIGFFFILLTIFLANVMKKDVPISIAERRKLATFPELTAKEVWNGKLTDEFETYAVDQFVERDFFREMKYFFSIEVLGQKDNHKLFVKKDGIYKMEYPLNLEAIEKSANKMQKIYEQYLQGMQVYYAIVPDKNYYLQDDHLKMDYDELQAKMAESLNEMTYINLLPELSLEDFYKTDIHWKQENIHKIANKIETEMGLPADSQKQYKEIELGDFYGVYYGQVGAKVKPDKLKYLSNEEIEACTTYNYETKKVGKVFDLEKYKTSADKYDIFLSGATPLLAIENPNATTDKELLLFRDSFGSSMAPLMIENYKKITLIDIRYMASNILEQYINFENQDVLFLYSGTVLNQNIFK